MEHVLFWRQSSLWVSLWKATLFSLSGIRYWFLNGSEVNVIALQVKATPPAMLSCSHLPSFVKAHKNNQDYTI